ncbi:MAG: ABC transporter permease, partial [Vibrio sp.]
WVFSAGIARDLPIGVVDLEQSSLSREAIRYYDASPTLEVTHQYTSVKQGHDALVTGDIYALVVLPNHLTRDTLLGSPATITSFYNSQFLLIGKLINSAMQQAQGTLNAKLGAVKNMSQGNTPPQQALAEAVPVQSQITPLFNANSHYGQFLASTAIPAMWQILIVATTVLSLSAHQRTQGLNAWLGEQPLTRLITTLMPYSVIYWLHGAIFLSLMYIWLGWPMHGHWWILLLAQALMVFACQCVGALFYFITLDSTRAMSLVAAFTAPAFAFMGITFPASDMPGFAQFWRNLLPISHYIDVQVKQVNYGVGFIDVSWQLLILATFSLLLVPIYAKLRSLDTKQGVAS